MLQTMNMRSWVAICLAAAAVWGLAAPVVEGQTAFLPTQLPQAQMPQTPLYQSPPGGIYVDADVYYGSPPGGYYPPPGHYPPGHYPPGHYPSSPSTWEWQLLPDGVIYRSYMAGPKESRMAIHLLHEKDEGWLADATLGGRVALWRFGSTDPAAPEGWEIQLEGAAFPRIDLDEEWDLVSSDFRAGVPLVYGLGKFQFKIGYYHISSHLGDEMIVKDPSLVDSRINYSRDAVVLGLSYFINPSLRIYSEAGWAFYNDGGSEPWEFQFGFSYSPIDPTDFWPAPFLAAHGHLREELNYGGNLTVQAGLQWRGRDGNVLRGGVHYLNGHTPQYQFFHRSEHQIGFGLWYDY